jgi:simple sugar transport system permease protein
MIFRKSALGLVSVLLALVLTLWLFRLPILPSIQLLLEGSLADKFAISRTLVKATPLLLTGLGMVVAWRAGAYNIGGEGQFVVGGICGAGIAQVLLAHLPASGWLDIPILIACALGGAAWAGIAGWLQVKRGVEAVISTILLNFVALELMSWAVEGPLQEPKRELPQTANLPSAAMLFRPDRQMDLHVGSVIAALTACVVFVYLFRTAAGYRLRVVGDNPMFARANRIDAGAVKLQAFLVSGALCGLAGGIEYTGTAGLIGGGFNQNWGFMGIPVALLAGLNPLATIVSALYFGLLLAGSENLGRFTQGGPTLVYVVQAVAVLAFAASGSLKLPRLNLQRGAAST